MNLPDVDAGAAAEVASSVQTTPEPATSDLPDAAAAEIGAVLDADTDPHDKLISLGEGVDTVSKTPAVDVIRERCQPEIYDPTKMPWEDIREAVLAIEQAHFGDESFDEETFIEDFGNPNNTVILMRDTETGKIVGFTYAEPLTNLDPEDWTEIIPTDEYPDANGREDQGEQTAYISDTALSPDYLRHRLVGDMMTALQGALTSRTDRTYRFLERDSAVANNYAANVAKTYADRIIYAQPHDSEYGPQVFYRMNLETGPAAAVESPESTT